DFHERDQSWPGRCFRLKGEGQRTVAGEENQEEKPPAQSQPKTDGGASMHEGVPRWDRLVASEPRFAFSSSSISFARKRSGVGRQYKCNSQSSQGRSVPVGPDLWSRRNLHPFSEFPWKTDQQVR